MRIPTFRYTGKTKQGDPASGSLEAPSRAAALVRLRQQGFWIEDLVDEQAPARRQAQKTPAAPIRWGVLYGLAPVSPGAMGNFFEQLGGLYRAGVTMATIAEDVSSRVSSPRLRRLLVEVTPRLLAGERLADCLSCYPQVLPAGVVGMVRAGELTGKLDRVAGYLADDYNGEQRVWWLMLLPKAYLTLVLVLSVIIPSFPMIVGEPNIMLGLQAWAAHFVAHELLLLLALLALYMVYRVVWHLPGLFRARDALAYRLPVWSLLTRRVGTYRFFRSLELCIEGGVDFPTAMDASARAAGNAVMVAQLEAAGARLREGIPMHDALSQVPFITREDLGMLGSASTGGTFDETLPRMAERAQAARDNTVRGLRVGGVAFIYVIASVLALVAAIMGYLLLYKTIFSRAGVDDLF